MKKRPETDSETRSPRVTPLRRDAQETRARLLLTAGEIFARDGFHGSNLREICDSADVNLGSVRYYFGGKEGLYREALVSAHQQILSLESPPAAKPGQSPEDALRAWLRFFLRVVLIRRPSHPYLMGMVSKELLRPTGALEDLGQAVFRPVRDQLQQVVATAMPPGTPVERAKETTHFIIMLCALHELGKPLLQILHHRYPQNEAEVAALADRIAQLILSGIRAEDPA